MRRFLLLVAVGIVRRSLAARSRRTAGEKTASGAVQFAGGAGFSPGGRASRSFADFRGNQNGRNLHSARLSDGFSLIVLKTGVFSARANGRGFFGRGVPDFQPAPPLVIVEGRQALAPVGRAWVPVAAAFALPMRSGALGAVQSRPPHALGRCVCGLARPPACAGRPPHSNGACGLSRAVLGALRTSCNSPASWL